MKTNAYLEITLDVKSKNREKAGGVYVKYKDCLLYTSDAAD